MRIRINIFIILSFVFISFNMWGLQYEAYFNQAPSNDPVDDILISKFYQLPANSRLWIAIYDIDKTNIVYALTNIATKSNITINMVVERDNGNVYTALLDKNPNITVKSDDNPNLMHNKFIIFDYNGTSPIANEIWTGSLNLTYNGVVKNAQNVIVLQNQPLASEYSNEFFQMFSQNLYGTSKTAHLNHTFTVDDSTVEVYFSPKDDPASRLADLINSAKYSIYFCIFAFSDPVVISALTNKFKEGIDVRGVCDAWSSPNFLSTGIYTVATQMGIPVYKDNVLNQPPSGYYLLHHKFMVIDYGHSDSDEVVVTGSYNWTATGNNDNDENMIVIHNASVAEDYFNEFKARYSEAGGAFPSEATPVSDFIAYAKYPEGIILEWKNPDDNFFKEVKIYYSEKGFVSTPEEGIFVTNVSEAAGKSVRIILNKNFQLYHRYYFTAFAYNDANNYNAQYATSLYFKKEDMGSISDNYINNDTPYKKVEVYFQNEVPDYVYIYNMNGYLIKSINTEGFKKVEWALDNEGGKKVGSGLYFLVYKIGDKREVKKILVVK